VKTLTPAERARRAAALGIVLPTPSAPPPRANGSHKAGKLTASPTPHTKLGLPKEAPALPPETQNSAAPPEPKPPKPYVERYKRARVLLVARYPAIFSAARPLAIGIHDRLREAFPEEELSSEDLRAFLQVWVRRKPYRAALERGDRRVNLDGSDAGPAHVDPRATVIEPV